nr:calcineurin B-like protein 9 isoform X2 [Ipomoea trifida]
MRRGMVLLILRNRECVLQVKQMVIAILMESDTKLSDDLLEEIIDKTFADVDADNDGAWYFNLLNLVLSCLRASKV